MAAAQASSSSENSQYHHFIPQFILRNFAHPYRPPTSKGRAKRPSNRGKRQRKGGPYPGDQVLHIINLSNDTPELTESPVRRTFGLADMYRDFSKVSDQNYLENHLSKLESNASMTILKIRKAFEAGNQDVWITRAERDLLRKFLFIMKYRGKGFHKRFVGDETEGYVEDDKEIFLKYMHEKGFQTPLDVWFASIKTILELKMDLQGEWRKNLVDRMYPEDAIGFIIHTEMMYLAMCTPSSTDAEFILTENCYNIFEGPNTMHIDPITGERRPGVWTSYHEFSPISPKLMMVLRSFVLPNSEEDANARIKRSREMMYELNAIQYANPSTANSILADLPIRKARNSYSSIGAQGVELLDGEDGSRRSQHRFGFQFFGIPTEQVNKINTIMLENAQECQAIAFNSQSALRTTLESYLALPADRGFKVVSNEASDPKLLYLSKLEYIMKQLGSHEHLIYQVQSTKLTDDEIHKIMGDMCIEYLPEQPTEFMQLYMKLGGSKSSMPKDMDQARRMVKMRIKIDVWSQGLEESKRENIRENLRDLFCQLPVRRLWYYLKQLRIMHLTEPPGRFPDVANDVPQHMDGPEDVVVKASHVIHPEKLGRLMYFSVTQQIFLLKNPGLDISADIIQNEAGAILLGKIFHFTFEQPGTICDCGLDGLQERARSTTTMLQRTQSYARWANPYWTDDENVEMLTRVYVRENIEELLGDRLPSEALRELKDVMFNILYPTYAKRGEQR